MLIRRASRAASEDCCAIAVMAKASIPGRTKTRLVPPLTLEDAAELNTAFLADITENLALAGQAAAIAPFMAFGPPGTAPFFEAHLPPHVGLLEVWFPNFGDCLFSTAKSLLDLGYGASCVLNSDSPTLPTDYLVETARALRCPGDRIVLGPATDGGYYLLGLKRAHRRLFEDVAWSTDQVARQTLERAAELGLEVVVLPPWYDVDDEAALRQLAREALDGIGFSDTARSHEAVHSGLALRRLLRHDLLHAPTNAELHEGFGA